MDDVRRNCLFSSVDVDDLLLLLFDRPIKLRKPLLINFLAVDAVVDDDEDDDDDDVDDNVCCCGFCGLTMVLSEDVFTSKLFNGIGLSAGDDCRFNKSYYKKKSSMTV